MKRLFITGTGTGIGKTLVTCALAHQLKARALKPIATGFDANDAASDTALLLQVQGLSNPDAISPWRFAAPLSPDMAARREGKTIVLDEVIKFCRDRKEQTLLIEGIGGVMTPLNDRETVLDWMRSLDWPVLLVAGTYLGSLSHTLTALRALEGLQVQGLVISESAESAGTPEEILESLARHLPPQCRTAIIPRLANHIAPWQNAPDLTHLI